VTQRRTICLKTIDFLHTHVPALLNRKTCLQNVPHLNPVTSFSGHLKDVLVANKCGFCLLDSFRND